MARSLTRVAAREPAVLPGVTRDWAASLGEEMVKTMIKNDGQDGDKDDSRMCSRSSMGKLAQTRGDRRLATGVSHLLDSPVTL